MSGSPQNQQQKNSFLTNFYVYTSTMHSKPSVWTAWVSEGIWIVYVILKIHKTANRN